MTKSLDKAHSPSIDIVCCMPAVASTDTLLVDSLHPQFADRRAGQRLCFNEAQSNSGFPLPRAISRVSNSFCPQPLLQLTSLLCPAAHKTLSWRQRLGNLLAAGHLNSYFSKRCINRPLFYGLLTGPANSRTWARLSRSLCSLSEKGAAPLPPFLEIISEEKDAT